MRKFFIYIFFLNLVNNSICKDATQENLKSNESYNRSSILNLINYYATNFKNINKIEYKGITFVGDKYCPDVSYESDLALLSMTNLKNTGANWVSIVVTEYQDTYDSKEIYPLYTNQEIKNEYYTYKTESIEGLSKLIIHAHNLGLNVMLKPHIDIAKEKDYKIHWRGDIGKNFNEDDWKIWFDSYEKFLMKYAKLGEDLKVEMFSLSCELIATNLQETLWRNLIKKVKYIYSGLLIDSANHDGQEFNKPWWDAVDYIGVDAYYIPIQSTDLSASIAHYELLLRDSLYKLKELSKKFKKDVIITEIGFCSGDCSIGDRNKKSSPRDQYIQAFFYESFIKIFSSEKIVKGYFWWAWNSDPDYGGINDHCISPQSKYAEFILKKYYGGSYPFIFNNFENKKEARCPCTI